MKRKIFPIILVLLVLSALGYRFFINLSETKEIKEKLIKNNEKYEKLKAEKEKLQKELEEAREGINQEKFVRDKLNMKKEGERVYRILDDEENVEKDNTNGQEENLKEKGE